MREHENELINKGYKLIAGIDEAGRGPLVGPVFAAAVIFPKGYTNKLINDSKKLTAKKREELYNIIIKDAIDYSIAFATSKEIDKLNILGATKLAMKRALKDLNNYDYALIDAVKLEEDINHLSIIKGDQKSISIAAASILAKVERDKYMEDLHNKYPEYDFINNKGYPTKKHLNFIKEHGIFDEYRFTFKPVFDLINIGDSIENENK